MSPPAATQIHSTPIYFTQRDLSPLRKLNLGSGPDIHPDFINLDKAPFPGVDILADINFHWPFQAARFDEIHAHHILEHCRSLIFQMNEAHRVLSPRGKLIVTVPWFSGQWAHGDPTHIHFFNHKSFDAFAGDYQTFKNHGVRGHWLLLSREYIFEPPPVDQNWLREMGFSRCLGYTVTLQRQ